VFVYPLGFYYLAPLVMLTPLGSAVPGGWGTAAPLPAGVAAAAVASYALGVFLHFGVDGLSPAERPDAPPGAARGLPASPGVTARTGGTPGVNRGRRRRVGSGDAGWR
jgi:hypothetical protein